MIDTINVYHVSSAQIFSSCKQQKRKRQSARKTICPNDRPIKVKMPMSMGTVVRYSYSEITSFLYMYILSRDEENSKLKGFFFINFIDWLVSVKLQTWRPQNLYKKYNKKPFSQ